MSTTHITGPRSYLWVTGMLDPLRISLTVSFDEKVGKMPRAKNIMGFLHSALSLSSIDLIMQ